MNTDVRYKLPFMCIISGPAVSGKSTFCVRFVQNLRYLYSEQFQSRHSLVFQRTHHYSNERAECARFEHTHPISKSNGKSRAYLFLLTH